MPPKNAKRKRKAAPASTPAPAPTVPTQCTTFGKLPIEVMEQILLDLPMKEILLNQRIAKQWKETVEWSRPLQRKLFFLPSLARADWFDPYNPAHKGRNVLGYAVTLNPLLVSSRDRRSQDDLFFATLFSPPFQPKDDHCIHRIKLDWEVSRPEWSCYRMRLISEPVTSIHVKIVQGARRKPAKKNSSEGNAPLKKMLIELGDEDTIASIYKKLRDQMWDEKSLSGRSRTVTAVEGERWPSMNRLVALEPTFTTAEYLERKPGKHNFERQQRDKIV